MADDVKIVMFCCNWCSYGGADTADDFRRDECDLDCSAINSPPNCFLSSTGISVDCG